MDSMLIKRRLYSPLREMQQFARRRRQRGAAPTPTLFLGPSLSRFLPFPSLSNKADSPVQKKATKTALAVPSTEPAAGETTVPLIEPLPPPRPIIVVSNAAAPLTTPSDPAVAAAAAAPPAPAKAAAAASPAAPLAAAAAAATAAATPAKAPAPQPKAAAAAATTTPLSFTAYTLSAAQATLSPDPATEGLATLILKGLSNTTVPRGSSGVLNGPLHTPTFLATMFPSGATVELRGSAAAAGGGDWGSCHLRRAALVASGAADGVAVLSGVVVPASLGDAGQATFGTQRGTLVFNRVSVLVTAPPRKHEGGGGAATQKLVAAAAAAPAPAPAKAPAKNATAAAPAAVPATPPKVSVAASTRPAAAVAAVKSVPMPSEFST